MIGRTYFLGVGKSQHVREGRLKGLAISAATRSPLAPEIPTMAEAGFPDFKIDSYFVTLAPAAVPDVIAGLLEREIRLALTFPDVQEKFRAQDLEAVGSSAEEAKARLRADTELWARIVKAANMRVD